MRRRRRLGYIGRGLIYVLAFLTATVVSATGLIGHVLVFALTGFFLTKAAIEFDSSEPESLDEAVRALAEAPSGTVYLLFVAFGMLAYAGFRFVEARRRDILE